jgi:hypothetical protein
MVGQHISSFGSWTSPSQPAWLWPKPDPRIDGDNIYWIEGRTFASLASI